MASLSSSTSSYRRNPGNKPKYIYEIPYRVLLEIHNAMDASGSWRRLAGELNTSLEWVSLAEQRMQRPTAALLSEWGHRNATIDTFFETLHRLGLYREMERIKPFVSRGLRHLLEPNDPLCTEDLPGPGDSTQLNTQPAAAANSWQGSNREYDEMSEPLNRDRVISQPSDDRNELAAAACLSGLNVFHFSKIKTATSNFCDQLLLGVGGFSKVYKGWMDGTTFAIKVIAPRDPVAIDIKTLMQHHRNEIEKLTKFRHPNIINLSGYSSEGPDLCLVMEYMEKGSLEKCLSAKLEGQSKPLSWSVRHRILKNAACGLQYLHSQNVHCIHGDIKSANILLDSNFVAKLADFGLAKQATTTHNMTSNATGYTKYTRHDINGNERAFGTLAYLPADFMANGAQFSRFTDVFSMGVVICEVLTGRKAYSKKEEMEKRFLKDRVKVLLRERCRGGQGQGQDLADIADKSAEGWPGNLWSRLMDLALHCLQDKMRNRPDSKALHERLTELCKEANKLISVSKDKKGEDDDDWPMNKLGSDCRENVMNIVVDDSEFQKKLQAVGTPSLVAHRGSDYMEKDLHLDDTAVIGDMYGPGDSNAKKLEDIDPEESRWLNYDASKFVDDDDTDVVKKESNLNAEADDPKFLKYDEKKLSNDTSLLHKVKPEAGHQKQLFNGLPVEQNYSAGSNAVSHIPSADMPACINSMPSSQPKSFQHVQEMLANLPESLKMEIYYDINAKLQLQQKNAAASKPTSNGSEPVPNVEDIHCTSVPVVGSEKPDIKEDRSLPNISCGTDNAAACETVNLPEVKPGCQLEDEAEEFRTKVNKLPINVSEDVDEGDIDTSQLNEILGDDVKFL